MRLLVPVDGSKYSLESVKVAVRHAKENIAGIYIMTVVPLVSDIDLELSASEREHLIKNMKRRGEEILEKAKGLLPPQGFSFIRTVLSTSPSVSGEIVSFAEKEKIDLIVIGSRGMGAASRFLLGSVAASVVAYSPCCVFVVKEPCWV